MFIWLLLCLPAWCVAQGPAGTWVIDSKTIPQEQVQSSWPERVIFEGNRFYLVTQNKVNVVNLEDGTTALRLVPGHYTGTCTLRSGQIDFEGCAGPLKYEEAAAWECEGYQPFSATWFISQSGNTMEVRVGGGASERGFLFNKAR